MNRRTSLKKNKYTLMLGIIYITGLGMLILYSAIVVNPHRIIGDDSVGCELSIRNNSYAPCATVHIIEKDSEIDPMMKIGGRCTFVKGMLFVESGNMVRGTLCSSRDAVNFYYACVITTALIVVLMTMSMNAFFTSRIRYGRKKINDYYNLAGSFLSNDTSLSSAQLDHDEEDDDDDEDEDEYLANGLLRTSTITRRQSGKGKSSETEAFLLLPEESRVHMVPMMKRYVVLREKLELLTPADMKGTGFDKCSLGGFALRYALYIDSFFVVAITISVLTLVVLSTIVIYRYPHYRHKWLFYTPLAWCTLCFLFGPLILFTASPKMKPIPSDAAPNTATTTLTSGTDGCCCRTSSNCSICWATCAGACVGMLAYRIIVLLVLSGSTAGCIYYLSYYL